VWWRCVRVQAMSSVEEPKDLQEYIALALDRVGGSEDLTDLSARKAGGAAQGREPAAAGRRGVGLGQGRWLGAPVQAGARGRGWGQRRARRTPLSGAGPRF